MVRFAEGCVLRERKPGVRGEAGPASLRKSALDQSAAAGSGAAKPAQARALRCFWASLPQPTVY